MALHLITGYAGQEHITSADQGAYNMGTFGEGEFVLDRGSKFAATVVTNNQITIADGEALMQGRFIKLPVGTTESVTIDNGSSGMKRKDLIVLRYSKNSGTGVETAALAVKKGTPSSGTPSDPAVTTGTITDGTDLVNEMKLYRVNLDGLNIASVDTLFSVKTTMVEYMDEYQLPIADADTLGGVKIGNNITRASDGKISIPDGSTSAKGVLKVGSGLNVSSGTISVPEGTTSTKGILKVGDGLNVSSGTVSVPTGSSSTKGILKVGNGLNVSSGTVSLKAAGSSSSELGGVYIQDGRGIQADSDGEIYLSKARDEIYVSKSDVSISALGSVLETITVDNSLFVNRVLKGFGVIEAIKLPCTVNYISQLISLTFNSNSLEVQIRIINLTSVAKTVTPSVRIYYAYLMS